MKRTVLLLQSVPEEPKMFRTAMIATALALAGCATTPKPAETAASTPKPPCATASRLPQANCAPGSSYSADDIKSTGVPGNSVGNALQMLDPAIRR
jgi:hypothetical protein